MIALKKSVQKLKRQVDTYRNRKGAVNAGDEVSVDYFALLLLIHYFDETQEDAQKVLVARNALDGVLLSFRQRKARKGEWPHDL